MARPVSTHWPQNAWLQKQAPPFEAMRSDGTIFSLEQTLADGPVILAFYPGDETPLARWLLESLNTAHAMSEEGIQVIGIGPGTKESHERFRKRSHLTFPLLIDEHLRIARLYEATRHALETEIVQATTVGIRSLERVGYYKTGLSKPVDILKSLHLYVSHRKTT